MSHHEDSEIIDRLGGPSEVARLCRIRPQAVSQWRRNGIPAPRRQYLELAQPHAFSVAAGLADEPRACGAAQAAHEVPAM